MKNEGRNGKKEICTLWWGFIRNFWVLNSHLFIRLFCLDLWYYWEISYNHVSNFPKGLEGEWNGTRKKFTHNKKSSSSNEQKRMEKNSSFHFCADNMHTNFHACKFFHMEYSMLKFFFPLLPPPYSFLPHHHHHPK